MQPGLYLAHKPVGVSSHARMREILATLPPSPHAQSAKPLPACHGGTLDPFASGLLLLLVGQATRLFERLHVLPKTYRATCVWGTETSNGDPTGAPIRWAEAAHLSAESLEKALGSFLGWTQQVPPPTSAKKVGGEPAYARVHRGESVLLPPSRVYLHQARWLSHDLPRTSELELVCRGGFYVRSLVNDLAQALGTAAHVGALGRTRIGPWDDAPEEASPRWIQGAAIVPWLPVRSLDSKELDEVKAWRPIAPGALKAPEFSLPLEFEDDGPAIAATRKSKLVALLQVDSGLWTPRINLWGGL